MPGLNGIEATRRIASWRQPPEIRVLILTTFDLDEYVYDALQAGASGFLLKDASPEQLTAAVRMVSQGDALLAPSITRRLIEEFAASRTPAVFTLVQRGAPAPGLWLKSPGMAINLIDRFRPSMPAGNTPAAGSQSLREAKCASGPTGRGQMRQRPRRHREPNPDHPEIHARAERSASKSPLCGSGAPRCDSSSRRSLRGLSGCRARHSPGRRYVRTPARCGPRCLAAQIGLLCRPGRVHQARRSGVAGG